MPVRIVVYQVLVEGQDDELQPGFQALSWPVRADAALREAVLHDHIFRTVSMRTPDLYGLFSSKFAAKAQLDFADVEAFIRTHPGRDVYLFNPFPQARYYTFNVWEQGEVCHPGLIEAANRVLNDLGYDIDLSLLGRHDGRHTCYCNFWIGSKEFWTRFMEFVGPLYAFASQNPGKGPAFRAARYHEPAVFFPFIYERMLTTYLSLHPQTRSVAYEPTRARMRRNCVTAVDRLIVDLFGDAIDRWDEESRIGTRHRHLFRLAHRTQRAIEVVLRQLG